MDFVRTVTVPHDQFSILRRGHQIPAWVWGPVHSINFCQMTSKRPSLTQLYSPNGFEVISRLYQCGIASFASLVPYGIFQLFRLRPQLVEFIHDDAWLVGTTWERSGQGPFINWRWTFKLAWGEGLKNPLPSKLGLWTSCFFVLINSWMCACGRVAVTGQMIS